MNNQERGVLINYKYAVAKVLYLINEKEKKRNGLSNIDLDKSFGVNIHHQAV